MLYALQNENKTIHIITESMVKAKRSLIPDFKRLVLKDLKQIIEENKTESSFLFPNGSIIRFISAENPDKVVGIRSDVLYEDEVNTIAKEVLDELEVRTRDYIFSSFNPTFMFEWYEDHHKQSNFIEDISNYLDNPFLEENIIKDILERAKKSLHFKQVHIDGEFATMEGLVLQEDIGDGGDWQIIDDIPTEFEKEYFAVDFGFKHKTAIIYGVTIGNSIYLKEMWYEDDKINTDIANELKQINKKNIPVICDSAEPRAIAELRRVHGINARPISKLTITDSVNNWKERQVFVTKDSLNLIKELRRWSYEKKKKDKNGHPIPVNEFDDAIAASRYLIDNHFKPIKKGRRITIMRI